MSAATHPPETDPTGVTTRSGWKVGHVRFQDKANDDPDRVPLIEARRLRMEETRKTRLNELNTRKEARDREHLAYYRSMEEMKLEYARKAEEIRTVEFAKRLGLKRGRSCWSSLTLFNVTASAALSYAFVVAFRNGWLDSWFVVPFSHS